MQLPDCNIKHRNLLIFTSVITKIFIVLKFVDMHDYDIYYRAILNIVQGALPWASGVNFYYPPLSVLPMIIAFMVSLVGGANGFILTMWTLMIVCDAVTTLCVYYIAMKLYSEQIAFIAAMLNATAISSAYFVVYRFDAFPTCLAMLAVLTTVYGDKTKGYLLTVAGLFTKVWPILLYPFLWIYNSRDNSIIVEGRERAFWFLLAGSLIFGLMIWIGYNKFLEYSDTVYCNTIPYTVFQYLQIMGVSIPFGIISNVFRIISIIIILCSIYYMYKHPQTLTLLLKLILLTLMATIFFSQYRSPQYIVWFSPFAALLIANDIWGIVGYICVQILAFIEFPLVFYTLYVNNHYTSPLALGFFTVFFITCGLLLWRSLMKDDPVPEKEFQKKPKLKKRRINQ